MARRWTAPLLVFAFLGAATCGPGTPGDSEKRPIIWDSMPRHMFNEMIKKDELGPEFVEHADLIWRGKDVLTVAFEGGDEELYALIEDAASDWTRSGGSLTFSFKMPDGSYRKWSRRDDEPAADIRISFRYGRRYGGYWSTIGVSARRISARKPTMNFEGFADDLDYFYYGQNAEEWAESYERSTILHEFGHALGLAHEHFHPDCQADMKEKELIAYYTGSPNFWKDDQARFELFTPDYIGKLYRDNEIVENPRPGPSIDRASIMLYQGKPNHFHLKERSPCLPSFARGYATSLSKGDASYFRRNY